MYMLMQHATGASNEGYQLVQPFWLPPCKLSGPAKSIVRCRGLLCRREHSRALSYQDVMCCHVLSCPAAVGC